MRTICRLKLSVHPDFLKFRNVLFLTIATVARYIRMIFIGACCFKSLFFVVGLRRNTFLALLYVYTLEEPET